jgi:type II secretory pathway predicted ATPase ExeA
MYEQFYGMQQPPFPLDPAPGLFFAGRQFVKTRDMLDYAVLRGGGIVVITGGAGCGKSMLIRSYLAGRQENLVVGTVSNPALLEESLVHGLMLAFRLDPVAAQNADLHTGLHAFVRTQHAAGRSVMLIVDEAQHLSPPTLERLRILTNPDVDGNGALQLVLIGQPQLGRTLARPDLEQLRQRIVAETELEPLSAAETKAYVAHSLLSAGAGRPIFSSDALSAIFQGSGGVPRVINILCDTALLYGYADELTQIDEALVRQVIIDRRLIDDGLAATIQLEAPAKLRAQEKMTDLPARHDDREIARQLFARLSSK